MSGPTSFAWHMLTCGCMFAYAARTVRMTTPEWSVDRGWRGGMPLRVYLVRAREGLQRRTRLHLQLRRGTRAWVSVNSPNRQAATHAQGAVENKLAGRAPALTRM